MGELLLLLFILFSICTFAIIRNNYTYETRIWFLYNDINKYKELPSYLEMHGNLKYIHLWTHSQWEKYLEKNKNA